MTMPRAVREVAIGTVAFYLLDNNKIVVCGEGGKSLDLQGMLESFDTLPRQTICPLIQLLGSNRPGPERFAGIEALAREAHN